MPVGSSEREMPWPMPVHHAQDVGMSTTMSDRIAGASVLARVVPVGAVAERVRDHATARPAWPVDVDGSWPPQVDWAWLSVDVAPLDIATTVLPGRSGSSSASRIQWNACCTSTSQVRLNAGVQCGGDRPAEATAGAGDHRRGSGLIDDVIFKARSLTAGPDAPELTPGAGSPWRPRRNPPAGWGPARTRGAPHPLRTHATRSA
jgi:hypothetical protein